MSNNLYNINNWATGTQYNKNDIILYTGNSFNYYCATPHISTTNFNTDFNNGDWVGTIYDRGATMPFFTWKPSYNGSNENTPRVKTISFSDGYTQRVPDGINNLLLNYNFTFEVREINEATAILHFLTTRNGCASFCFIPPAPRGNLLRFVCPKFTDIQKYYNNYQIQANFVQNPV